MSQWSTLTRFQRVLLIALTALLAVFTVVYPVLSRRKGIQYRDALLLWSAQGENDVYAGRVDGARTVFTVAPDGTIQYRRGDTDYGPYTVALDPSAVPRDSDMADVLTGVEVRDGADILFRGGWYNSSFPLLVDENGAMEPLFSLSVHTSSGKVYGPDGQTLAPSYEPTASFLLQLALEPPLTHRGELYAYFTGTLLAVVGIVSILFADRLFRWDLRFRIRDPEGAEPSEWEIFTRYLGWIVCTAGTLIVYLMGAFAIV